MRHPLLLSLVLALGIGSAASAQTVRYVERAATGDPRSHLIGDPNRMVCKTVVPTGTRLAKAKACMTAREWAEKTYENQKQLERIQTRPNRPDGG